MPFLSTMKTFNIFRIRTEFTQVEAESLEEIQSELNDLIHDNSNEWYDVGLESGHIVEQESTNL